MDGYYDSGVIVRLTTCKGQPIAYQTKPYYTLPPWNGGIAGRPGIRADVSTIRAVSFPGYTGEDIVQVWHGESLNKFIMVDVGLGPTTQKSHGLSTTPFVKELVGYFFRVRLTTCTRLTNSLPKLSHITWRWFLVWTFLWGRVNDRNRSLRLAWYLSRDTARIRSQ